MSKSTEAGQAARSTKAAFLHASPAIMFLGLMIWFASGLLTWIIGAAFGGSLVAWGAVGVVLAIPAAWATWKMVGIATEAERYPDHYRTAEMLNPQE